MLFDHSLYSDLLSDTLVNCTPAQVRKPNKGAGCYNVGEAKDLLRKAREAMKAKTLPEL